MTKNDSNYGSSQFRQFPTFGSSGISVSHSTEVGRNTRPSGTRKPAGMSPMGQMKYQEPGKTKVIGSRPVGKRQVPSTGVGDAGFMNDLAEEMGCDEFEPMTSEEKHTAEVF